MKSFMGWGICVAAQDFGPNLEAAVALFNPTASGVNMYVDQVDISHQTAFPDGTFAPARINFLIAESTNDAAPAATYLQLNADGWRYFDGRSARNRAFRGGGFQGAHLRGRV